MATSDDDLRINTLHRFAKHSPRLTLQEYSHCEVPAGCGGVVLRWVDPRVGPSVRVAIVTIGVVDTWLDGQRLVGDRVVLTPGTNVLTLHFQSLGRMTWRERELALPAPIPAALALYPDRGPGGPRENRLADITMISERWTPGPLAAPPIAADFDDSAWHALAPADAAMLGRLPDDVRPSFERLTNNSGMTLLSIGEAGMATDEVWLRMAFILEGTR